MPIHFMLSWSRWFRVYCEYYQPHNLSYQLDHASADLVHRRADACPVANVDEPLGSAEDRHCKADLLDDGDL